MAVTHTQSSPTAMSPPGPETPTSMVATTRFVIGSRRETVPSPWFNTQTEDSVQAMNRGDRPTGTWATTWWLRGSTRETKSPAVQDTQTEPPPTAGTNDSGAVRTRARTLFVLGSICTRVPSRSATSHTPSAPTAIPPSLSATDVAIWATTLFELAST